MKYCIIQDKIEESKNASISITDLAVTRGVGLFDFLRAFDKQPMYLQDHIDRLFRGAESMGISFKLSNSGLSSMIKEMLEKNDVTGDSGVKILVTGGTAGGFSLANPGFIVTQETVNNLPENLFVEGSALLLDDYTREVAEVKSTNYMHAVMRNADMQKYGAIDILYHTDGVITECARSNFFIVKDGVLYTPEESILHGITRKRVIEIAPDVCDLSVSQISLADVEQADEVFMTSTVKRVLPVKKIQGIDRQWKVGPITTELMKRLKARDIAEHNQA